jgi:hypothetical protein
MNPRIFTGANNSWAHVQLSFDGSPPYQFKMRVNEVDIVQDTVDVTGFWSNQERRWAPKGRAQITLKGESIGDGIELSLVEEKKKSKVKPEKAPTKHHVKPKKEAPLIGEFRLLSYHDKPIVQDALQKAADKLLNKVKNKRPVTMGYVPFEGEDGPELVVPLSYLGGYWDELPKYPDYEETKKGLDAYYEENGAPLSDLDCINYEQVIKQIRESRNARD